MSRQPVTATPSPSYPVRKASTFRSLGRKLRRVGVAVVAASSFWVLGGCPFTIAGDIAPPSYFICADTSRDSRVDDGARLSYPGTFDGSLCGDQNAWGVLEVEEQVTLAFGLDGGSWDDVDAVARIVDPEGAVVAEVRAGDPTTELAVTPGRWLVGVSEADAAARTYSYFELHIEVVSE